MRAVHILVLHDDLGVAKLRAEAGGFTSGPALLQHPRHDTLVVVTQSASDP